MTDPVDAVLFDLDDTLCTYCRSGDEVLDAAFADAGVDPFFEAADYYDRFEEYVDDCDTIAELRERCFADIAADRGLDPDHGLAVARAYERERDQTNVEHRRGASEAVEALATDHRLGLVTNGAPGMQRTKLDALGLADHFETVVFAGHEVPRKPDPQPFERALADLGVGPERAVHVGDSPESDVAGAHAAGLRSVWLRDPDRSHDLTPDWTVDSPADLVDHPWK
jgi:putative hydrolase of the HAD superfamily